MPYEVTYTGATPTVDADFDVWGDELNDDALAPIKADLDGIAAVANAAEETADAALPKAGGTMTGDLILDADGPSSTLSAGYRGAPRVNFSSDKTLALSDAGKLQRLTGSTGRTLTIPPSSSVGFPIGTVIPLRNAATASLTIERGSGVTLRVPGGATSTDRTLISYGVASLLLEDTNVWLLTGIGVS